jgi:hydrogenase nickel incorporation protein HypA/HybF
MHELAIATRIVETVSEVVAGSDVAAVDAVSVRVGRLSTVVPDALRFAWSEVIEETALAGAALQIEEVEPAIACAHCQATFTLPGVRLICPGCGQPAQQLIQGQELDILSIETRELKDSPKEEIAS